MLPLFPLQSGVHFSGNIFHLQGSKSRFNLHFICHPEIEFMILSQLCQSMALCCTTGCRWFIDRWWFQIFWIFCFYPWGNDPIWLVHIFQMGGEKPPTRQAVKVISCDFSVRLRKLLPWAWISQERLPMHQEATRDVGLNFYGWWIIKMETVGIW